MSENERIARAAALEWPLTTKQWRTDPGAVATWLLPVLEARWPEWVSTRVFHPSENKPNAADWKYVIDKDEWTSGQWRVVAPTWHEAVIAAILATGEAE